MSSAPTPPITSLQKGQNATTASHSSPHLHLFRNFTAHPQHNPCEQHGIWVAVWGHVPCEQNTDAQIKQDSSSSSSSPLAMPKDRLRRDGSGNSRTAVRFLCRGMWWHHDIFDTLSTRLTPCSSTPSSPTPCSPTPCSPNISKSPLGQLESTCVSLGSHDAVTGVTGVDSTGAGGAGVLDFFDTRGYGTAP